MKSRIKTLSLFLILLLSGYFTYIYAEPLPKDAEPLPKEKEERVKRRINWGDIKGAIQYEVQVADLTGKIIVKDTVDSSQYDIELPYGRYRIRIGAVNKFGDMGNWSDWANISIKRPVKEPAKVHTPLPDMSLRIGVGISYFHVLPDWDDLYYNSFKSVSMNIGVCPLDYSFFRYLGLEIEGSSVQFKSKDVEWRITTDMKNIIAGANLFFITKFDFPLNIILRGGGGISYTEQEYEVFDESDGPTPAIDSGIKENLVSKDPYVKAGLSIEYRFMNHLYLEGGADYYLVRYLSSDLKSLKYFLLIGTGI